MYMYMQPYRISSYKSSKVRGLWLLNVQEISRGKSDEAERDIT